MVSRRRSSSSLPIGQGNHIKDVATTHTAADQAILYFNAAGDAGLDRGLILTAVGLVLWVAVGTAVTKWFDRKGLDRLRPEYIEHLQASVRYYQDQAATAASDPPGTPTPAGPDGAG